MKAQFTAGDIARITRGRLVAGGSSLVSVGISTDSRLVRAGNLFVALKGERADGHDFAREALAKGAAGLLVSRRVEGLAIPEGRFAVLVEDTLLALGDLAGAYRAAFDIPVIGVTGSVGKTTTKDLIAAVLESRWNTLKSEGNYNTDLGLPLTLFKLEPGHGACVLEMAMRGLGEIARLAAIARPRVGVITNIGVTHLELLGTVENIASAKGELLEALPPDGVAVLNGDDPWLGRLAAGARSRVIYYGLAESWDFRAEDIRPEALGVTSFTLVTPAGKQVVSLQLPGRHNVINAVAAAAVGTALGLTPEEIRRGIEAARPAGMRMEIRKGQGLLIINDTYNASPASTRAALVALRDLARGRRVAVLGNMLELGEYALQGHREVGAAAVENGVDLLVTVGELARYAGEEARVKGLLPRQVVNCADNHEAIACLGELLARGDTVLVKGSRGMRMEQIVEALGKISL